MLNVVLEMLNILSQQFSKLENIKSIPYVLLMLYKLNNFNFIILIFHKFQKHVIIFCHIMLAHYLK